MTIKRAREIMATAKDFDHWVWLINKEQRNGRRRYHTGSWDNRRPL